jgi:hypothetical protein
MLDPTFSFLRDHPGCSVENKFKGGKRAKA